MEQDFRHVLRHATTREHERLDRSISTLNIAKLSDFQTFIQLHMRCFSAMKLRLSDHSMCRAALEEMIDGLTHDLRLVSGRERTAQVAMPMAVDPLAVDYLVAGSRLGSQVLHKRWKTSDEPAVQNAGHYFGLPSDPDLWRKTCSALSEIPNDALRATIIINDTRALFQMFMTEFEALVADQGAFV